MSNSIEQSKFQIKLSRTYLTSPTMLSLLAVNEKLNKFAAIIKRPPIELLLNAENVHLDLNWVKALIYRAS